MEQQLDEKSKQLLTRASERISILYVEKAKIEQSEYGVQIVQGKSVSEIPITTISCIILGPGTSITHRAVSNIAIAGCSICWMGMDQATFYAYGEPATTKSKNLLKQIHYYESKTLRMQVVHQMYNWRYPNEKIKSMTLEQLRGFEGHKMQENYTRIAKEYGIEWNGRYYDHTNFDDSDVVNKYISALNHIFYAFTRAIILIMGYSPSIGFIHTGHTQSFVFDITDLFKERFILPLAFELTKEYGFFSREKMILQYRQKLNEQKIISQMVDYINELFNNTKLDQQLESITWNIFK